MTPISDAEIATLDAAVQHMLRTGEQGTVEILGAGEITCVLGHQGYACKRLPPFGSREAAVAYGKLLERYVTALRARGLEALDTTIATCPPRDGRMTAYVVQPRLPSDSGLHVRLTGRNQAAVHRVFCRVLEHVVACVTPTLGLDAQLSNFCLDGERLVYVDTSTPLLRNERGEDLLPTEIFVAALPAIVRGGVRRFFVRDLLDRFFDLRSVSLDLLGNMANYGLGEYTEVFLAEVNRRLDEPLTLREVERYRRSESITWIWIRRLLAVEQLWRRWIKRSAHPLMLPSQFRVDARALGRPRSVGR